MNDIKISSVLALFFSFTNAAVLPAVAPCEGIARDIIRYMKCAKLFVVKPDVGGYEQGQAAYWAGPDTKDFFFNGRGSVYGGDSNQSGIWADFYNSPKMDKPPMRAFIGKAKQTTGSQQFGYNCKTGDSFEYEDEKYGTCQSRVTCQQKDALKLGIHGSEDTVEALGLDKPEVIFGKIDEVFDKEAHTCDPKDIELSVGCKVKFDCEDNSEDGKVITGMVELRGQNLKDLHSGHEVKVPGSCDLGNDRCTPDSTAMASVVPSQIQMVARSIPQVADQRYGPKVVEIKATIPCEAKNKDALRDALGTMFSLTALMPQFAEVAGVGDVVTETACGIVNEED
ncbi:hypothetical protein K458DRAFT_402721 [Lentithecium fluviatile CBS 122367]|uniref:Uncharacterized protein n=1 Tax=Lentithecium fluviatile CBS 122367 TaxID=1168545 RepID=A0A6G1J7N7_9PLEO|nr:hypothetical protein K458DRAFT_402721 [Lentithecium fluviatile CBS 122367]